MTKVKPFCKKCNFIKSKPDKNFHKLLYYKNILPKKMFWKNIPPLAMTRSSPVAPIVPSVVPIVPPVVPIVPLSPYCLPKRPVNSCLLISKNCHK